MGEHGDTRFSVKVRLLTILQLFCSRVNTARKIPVQDRTEPFTLPISAEVERLQIFKAGAVVAPQTLFEDALLQVSVNRQPEAPKSIWR